MTEVYRVLARKYRPQTLSDLVGQDVLVQTLSQAIKQQKLPNAFVLHGIRGVGKTTTARIIAKALNCTGMNPTDPTPNPCDTCPSCVAITEDRHLDIIEMDAASRTGVDDIREVIEAARYKAISANYKIYIIDEVHMLSKSAFNALLKTLEEPPPHVKFIFATTELKKIPDTVLSRCMKLDLCRISGEVLLNLFKKIATAEAVSVEDEALALIVRAADGSARDGLSLLDQAIALSGTNITAEAVRNMLGLVDRGRLFTLIDTLFAGNIVEALTEVRSLHRLGGDSVIILQELLDLTYWITCLKVTPALKNDQTWPISDREQGMAIAQKISLAALSRAWQVLSKGYEEVTRSPLPTQATEMVLIRLCHLSEFPSAADLATLLQGGSTSTNRSTTSAALTPTIAPIASPAVAPAVITAATPLQQAAPISFEGVLSIVASARQPLLYSYLMQDVHLVSFAPYKIELRLNERAPKTLATELEALLLRTTGEKWQVALSGETGQATVADQNIQRKQQLEVDSLNHPVVQEILAAFPNASAAVHNTN
ncbi:DNA polymerase III subunit gamma/tau [Candidatus Paracaedibacter symbiosus]|uniref:DNA polymerase III subunit gamma/tau n=1 Tax=Candidatus Paracaedibacter symbiosus TaxID=244582 RepID=UPI000509B2A2|nr:DNA polymerase III subunit gamma/tau [Candidatus Paracaedibacter symbiosus]